MFGLLVGVCRVVEGCDLHPSTAVLALLNGVCFTDVVSQFVRGCPNLDNYIFKFLVKFHIFLLFWFNYFTSVRQPLAAYKKNLHFFLHRGKLLANASN